MFEEAGLTRLRQLVQAAALGPSTRAIVEAAQQRGIPTLRLTEHASLFQLGWGSKQQRIQATITSKTNHIAGGIASDKDLTKRLLKEAGLPVPRGLTVSTLEARHQIAAALASFASSAGQYPLDLAPQYGLEDLRYEPAGETAALIARGATSESFANA